MNKLTNIIYYGEKGISLFNIFHLLLVNYNKFFRYFVRCLRGRSKFIQLVKINFFLTENIQYLSSTKGKSFLEVIPFLSLIKIPWIFMCGIARLYEIQPSYDEIKFYLFNFKDIMNKKGKIYFILNIVSNISNLFTLIFEKKIPLFFSRKLIQNAHSLFKVESKLEKIYRTFFLFLKLYNVGFRIYFLSGMVKSLLSPIKVNTAPKLTSALEKACFFEKKHLISLSEKEIENLQKIRCKYRQHFQNNYQDYMILLKDYNNKDLSKRNNIIPFLLAYLRIGQDKGSTSIFEKILKQNNIIKLSKDEKELLEKSIEIYYQYLMNFIAKCQLSSISFTEYTLAFQQIASVLTQRVLQKCTDIPFDEQETDFIEESQTEKVPSGIALMAYSIGTIHAITTLAQPVTWTPFLSSMQTFFPNAVNARLEPLYPLIPGGSVNLSTPLHLFEK